MAPKYKYLYLVEYSAPRKGDSGMVKVKANTAIQAVKKAREKLGKKRIKSHYLHHFRALTHARERL
uniref:Uncharacterized protein n=1 Tax=viral metagenome TaxID=1070528 RepID=A0A6M3L2V8_9ZZZZ